MFLSPTIWLISLKTGGDFGHRDKWSECFHCRLSIYWNKHWLFRWLLINESNIIFPIAKKVNFTDIVQGCFFLHEVSYCLTFPDITSQWMICLSHEQLKMVLFSGCQHKSLTPSEWPSSCNNIHIHVNSNIQQ